jgi:hypothetical protein
LKATAVLTLELTAPQGGNLSELLRFSSSGLVPETYRLGGQIRPLQLSLLPALATFFIAPNPTKGAFTLQSNGDYEDNALVQMMDAQGKIVFEKIFPATKGLNRWEIETSGMPTGLYFLKMDGKAAGKVVVAY